jgi:hypothetical protein
MEVTHVSCDRCHEHMSKPSRTRIVWSKTLPTRMGPWDLCPSCRDMVMEHLGLLPPQLGGLFPDEATAKPAPSPPPVAETKPAEINPNAIRVDSPSPPPVLERVVSPYNVAPAPMPAPKPAPQPAADCNAKRNDPRYYIGSSSPVPPPKGCPNALAIRRGITQLLDSRGPQPLADVVDALDPNGGCEFEIRSELDAMINDGALRYVPGPRLGTRSYALPEPPRTPKPTPKPVPRPSPKPIRSLVGATR